MKKTITYVFVIFLCQLSLAQVIHKDFGAGLVISMDENFQFDINEDGYTDLYVNSLEGELGFDPIPGAGCMGTNLSYTINHFGSRPLQMFEQGDLIKWGSDAFTWSEDDGTSAYSGIAGFDDGWASNEEKLVGFMLLEGLTVSCGWMKIQIDEANETLVIHELAYQEGYFTQSNSGIYAGTLNEVGDPESTTIIYIENLDMNVFPNPASEDFYVQYEMPTRNDIDFQILDLLGRTIYHEKVSDSYTQGFFNVDISQYIAGSYFVKISTPEEQLVKQLIVK